EELAVFRMATAAYGLVTTILIYFLAQRLFGTSAAILSALAVNVMTFDQCASFNPASTEFFMLLWMSLSLYLWYLARSTSSYRLTFLAGIAAGLAYQTKQSGLTVIMFLVLERVWKRMNSGKLDSWKAAALEAGLASLGFGVILGGVWGYFALNG